MDDIPDFNLSDLEDSLFDVHVIVFKDENELFTLPSYVDYVMKSNPQARFDGVFGLEGTKPEVTDALWDMFDANAMEKHLAAQFLIAPDGPKSFVMEHRNVKLKLKQTQFSKAVQNAETFKALKPNCCTRALKQGGPKEAVKHFYESLLSKVVTVPKWHEPTSGHSLGNKRAIFDTRQSLLKSQDPFTRCALIENSMKSKAHEVKRSSEGTGDEVPCMCHICHLHEHSEKIICEPLNLKEDGEGDNCSLYYSCIEEADRNFLYVTPNFALAHLCHLNMLTDLDSYYPGISYPFIYLGGLHSFFPIHVEDMSLWSINYLHAGHPKLWIIVAPCDVSKLSKLLTSYGLHNLHRVCMFKLSHKSTVLFPQFLLHHKINFKIIIKEPGDFLFLAPNAAHTGGNMGENISEACNIGTPDWLPYGSVASIHDCRCMENKIHMDITALIKIHRKDLLEYHFNKSMHINYKDGHFEKSIMLMSTDAIKEEPFHSTVGHPGSRSASSSNPLSRKAVKSTGRAPVSCPVKNCFTEYKVSNKNVMLAHICVSILRKLESKQYLMRWTHCLTNVISQALVTRKWNSEVSQPRNVLLG